MTPAVRRAASTEWPRRGARRAAGRDPYAVQRIKRLWHFSLAEKASAEDGFISVEHAEAVCLQRFVRRLGVVCARENARLRLRGLTFLDTHGKVRPYIKPHCERHWRLRQDAAVHWRLPRL